MKNKLLLAGSVFVLTCFLLTACASSEKTEGGSETAKPAGARTFSSNTGGNRPLSGSPYGYEMYSKGGNKNKLMWYGPDERGGAAFRAEWNKPNDFLGRVGYFWGTGKKYTEYKNIFVDFDFERSEIETGGSYSYIGIYGWTRNPLIEYYIVEDWFGNQWQADWKPMGTGTTQGEVIGSFTVDGSDYEVHKATRTNAPSIEGNRTFTQYFSIRQEPRQSGTISVTEHFKQWEKMGLNLGNSMYECKFLVEAGGGVGYLDLSHLSFRMED